MGVVGSKDTVQQVPTVHTTSTNVNSEGKHRRVVENVLNGRTSDLEESSTEEYDEELEECISEIEPKQVNEQLHERGKDEIIGQTNIVITEAEKMLKIYNEERKKAERSIEDHCREHGINIMQKREGRNREPDIGKIIKQPQYKTYDYHRVSRYTPIPETKDTLNIACDTSVDVRAVNSHEVATTVDNKPYVVNAISSVTDMSSKYISSKFAKMQHNVQPPSFPHTNDTLRQRGTFLSNTFSQYCPNLLEQRKHETSNFPSKPMSSGILGLDKGPLLTQQGEQHLRYSDTQVNPLSRYEYDAKQQNVLHELRDIGIIEKTPVFDRYTLSTGSPLRKPPPRTNQLPPIENDVHSQFNEFQFAPLPPLPKKFKSQKSPVPVNVLHEKYRNIVVSPIDMLHEQSTGVNTTTDNVGADTSDELFVKFDNRENIGDTVKRKLKIIDMNIL